MTVTYRTSGRLTHPVSDLRAAREYLDESMHLYVDDDLRPVIHTIKWDLASEDEWFVVVVAEQVLDTNQLSRLSEWISGQNSDGLGEGFEQQPFAEHENEDFDEDETDLMDASDFIMSSFDWQTNPCTLEEVVVTR